MRRDGDRLAAHVHAAKARVLLCAPFVKVGVLKALLDGVADGVDVRIVTRWHPAEVAAGVSDLEVFDVAQARPNTRLTLLDHLHAKIYLADDVCLTGSANLTATALGWCSHPNLEVLTSVPLSDESVARCLEELEKAREATEAERDSVAAAASKIAAPRMPLSEDNDPDETGTWVPRLAAPERLFVGYVPAARARLIANTADAAEHDLRALGIPPGLDEEAFKVAVAEAFSSMPAIAPILKAAEHDLTDADAIRILEGLSLRPTMPLEAQWRAIRDWMTYFLGNDFETVPQSFVTRPRPGTLR